MLTDDQSGLWLGRVWRADVDGPAVVTIRAGQVLDITCAAAPTTRDVLELPDPAAYVANASGEVLCKVSELSAPGFPQLLAPCDLQAVKACGNTFARAAVSNHVAAALAGDPGRLAALRSQLAGLAGGKLEDLRPGSAEAAAIKALLLAEGLWVQGLEVAIGPDAQIFTKAQPMAAVGHEADVGLHPVSAVNNPEGEVVLAVSSAGVVRGACLGNDVNLRDVEGRAALLLGTAKDNNASCAIGPMIRLFDAGFSMDDVLAAEVTLEVAGPDGYRDAGVSRMAQIYRDPLDLVAQTCGRHHQYPDGLMLFLGTMYAPSADRHGPGSGFTHVAGDVVTISAPGLGSLRTHVQLATQCPEWTFGTRALMANLSARGLL